MVKSDLAVDKGNMYLLASFDDTEKLRLSHLYETYTIKFYHLISNNNIGKLNKFYQILKTLF